jgi:hypothetical protein
MVALVDRGGDTVGHWSNHRNSTGMEVLLPDVSRYRANKATDDGFNPGLMKT